MISPLAKREEGWYAVLIGNRLACLYWTGRAWEFPRNIYQRVKLPEGAEAAAAPIAWPGDA